MSSYRIGMNLRVTEDSNQGGRRYMEDRHAIRFVKNEEGGFEFAYFGIFDGHGGGEASKYARDYLLDEITKYDCFWSDNDDDILFAIKSAFLDTHYGMWKVVDKWPRTGSGLPSTAGTTASIGIIKNSKLYIGHVGDSAIVLGHANHHRDTFKYAKSEMLTKDHKPDDPVELERIQCSGGQVVAKSGVQRVVWNRPRTDHRGPIRRSTQIDRIPFLAVARSLGDLWSYNYLKEEFVVSPEPDVSVHKLDANIHKCLIIGSDGLWNMLSADEAVSHVFDLETQFEYKVVNDPTVPLSYWINPAERLVQAALNKWRMRLMKADNTSAIVVLIDPLGPRKLSILRRKREERMRERAESRINSKSVTDLLTANETLNKSSPKKESNRPVIATTVQSKIKPVMEDLDKVTKQNANSSPSVNLDDSIQLRNGHALSPFSVSVEHKHDFKSTHKHDSKSTHKHDSKSTHDNKSSQIPTKHKLESATSDQTDILPTRMATRFSPQKSPLGQNTVSNSSTKQSMQSATHTSLPKPADQKCLQPSKCMMENVKNTMSSKVQSGMKVRDVENMFTSMVQLKGQHQAQKSAHKTKAAKSKSASATELPSDSIRSHRKAHMTKSLSTRISLRLRRLRQKTQKIRGENKDFVKAGVKRKLDGGHASPTPAPKKLKHS